MKKSQINHGRITACSVLLMLFVFLMSPAVIAVQDFDATINQQIDVTTCSTQHSEVTVTNTGDDVIDLQFDAQGSAAGWFSLPKEVITLQQNEEKKVSFDINVPCNVKEGAHSATIVITDSTDGAGVQKNIVAALNVQKIVNIDITPAVFSQTINPCSPAVFNVTVQNTGNFADSFSFSLAPVDGADISPAEAILSSHQSKNVVISFKPDDCALFGEFPLVFTAQAEKSGVRADLDLQLTINPADVLTIADGVDKILTNYSLATAKIFVKNNGDAEASYKLSVDGPSWIKLDSDSVTVGGHSDAGFLLIMNPDASVLSGSLPLTVTAASTVSDRVYAKNLAVQLSKSSLFNNVRGTLQLSGVISSIRARISAAVLKDSGATIIILILLLVMIKILRWNRSRKSADAADANVDAMGKEEREDAADTSRDKSEEQNKVYDAEAYKQDNKVRRAVEKELRSKFKLIPKSAIVSPIHRRVQWLTRLIILMCLAGIVFAGYAWKNLVIEYLDFIALGITILTAFFVVIKCVRKWRVNKKWKFLMAKDAAEFKTGWKKGLTKLSFTVTDAVEWLGVVVKKTKPKNAVSPAENVYCYAAIGSNATQTLFNDVGAVFKIKKSWLSKRNAAVKDVRVALFVKNKWKFLPTESGGEDHKYIFVEAHASAIGTFAVTCKTKAVKQASQPMPVEETVAEDGEASDAEDVIEQVEKKEERKQTREMRITKPARRSRHVLAWIALFVVLGLIFTGIGYVVKQQPQIPQTPKGGIAAQVWSQDSVHRLNITHYFSDPDGDPLTFTTTPADNIAITFDGSDAVFTPDQGWSGSRSTVFTARDPSNGTVSSNDVPLIVKKSLIPAAITPFVPQIISGVLFVIVVVLLVVFRENIITFLEEDEE